MNEPTLFPESQSTPMTENTSNVATIAAPETRPVVTHTTIALSLLVHGEAVRFNRGNKAGEGFDFKFMKDENGRAFPYVSAQCFKRYWRESLPTLPSPITKVDGKNQAFTSGNPLMYVDDDLFGYMIAGADSEEEEKVAEGEEEIQGVSEVDAALDALKLNSENIKDSKKLLTKLQDESKLSIYLRENLSADNREIFDSTSKGSDPSEEVIFIILDALNRAIQQLDFVSSAEVELKGKDKKAQQKILSEKETTEVAKLNRLLILRELKGELQEKPKEARPTTRRTAPLRMHALVAFSGIKTALDFQTFSRYVAASGLDSTLVPARVGIYSGWLKTRILIEASRIGKFYVAPKNLDLLPAQVEGIEIQGETNFYDRAKAEVKFVELDATQRQERLKMAIEALANVGNNQGPASGALHDGSLKPKAFIGAVMNCADSPFDSLWQGTSERPEFDLMRLETVLSDWEDLFLEKTIYVGLPVELFSGEEAEVLKSDIENRAKKLGFNAIVGSPRKTLLKFAGEAAAKAIPTS